MNADVFLSLATPSHLFTDETAAREFVESKIWPRGPKCPHCGGKKVYTITSKAGAKNPVRPGLYKCKACRKPFTVRMGTIFEDSHVPFCKWLMAFHLMTSSKKGVSSLQISRELGITVKSAWFMTHRIRLAMQLPDDEPPLGGSGEPEQHKPGPHEKLHSLYPLTFEQAIKRAMRYKPKKKESPPNGKPKNN